MGQAIGWLVAFGFVGLMIWALVRDDKSRRTRSSEQDERDVADARHSLLRAGMLELDKFVGDTKGKRAAVEHLKDEEEGMHKTGSKGDDQNRTSNEGGEEAIR